MREVKYYVAWDDSEFETKEACMEYEQGAIIAMSTINNCYDFIDKNGGHFIAPQNWNVEEWLEWLSNAGNHCHWIKIYKTLPEFAANFIDEQLGLCICPSDFCNMTGLFEYDDWKNEWVKVGEQPTLIFC